MKNAGDDKCIAAFIRERERERETQQIRIQNDQARSSWGTKLVQAQNCMRGYDTVLGSTYVNVAFQSSHNLTTTTTTTTAEGQKW